MKTVRQSQVAEMALVGCLVVGGLDVWPKVRSVPSDAFYWPSHRAIWEHCRSECLRGRSPSLISVQAANLDLELAIQCAEQCASVRDATAHAGTVLDLAAFRAYREFAAKLAGVCDDVSSDPADLGRLVTEEVRRIEGGRPPVVRAAWVSEVVASLGEKPDPGVPTGIACFDSSNAHGGMALGEPVVIGAETGVGKTLLGVQVAVHAAREGHRVLAGTFEIKQGRFVRRMLQHVSGYASSYHAGVAGDQHLWDAAVQEAALWDMEVYEPVHMGPGSDTVEAFVDYAERTHEKAPWNLIVVDYAQLLRTRKTFMSDIARHEHTASELRMLALRTGSAVLVLAQAIRDVNDKGRLRLRNSREYEMVANAILLVDRKTKDGEDEHWLVADKNRDGKRFKQRVKLVSPWGRFDPVEREAAGVYRGGD